MDFDTMPEAPAPAAPIQPASLAGTNFDTMPEAPAPASLAGSDFDSMPDQTAKYSSLGQNYLGIAEQAAQGAAGPFATAAEMGLSKLGVPGITPEDIEGRKQGLGPWSTGVAQGLGMVGSLAAGPLSILGKGAEGALAAHGLYDAAATGLQKYGQNIFKAMAEMAGVGIGEESNKQLKGESQPATPSDAVARTLAAGGASELFGGVTAGLFTGAADTAAAGLRQIAASKIGQKAIEFAQDFGAAMNTTSDEFGPAAAGSAPEAQAGVQNTSLAGLQNRIEQAGGVPQATSRTAVEAAAARVPMESPFHPMQLDALDSPQAAQEYQMAKESSTDVGKILRDNEAIQKNELVGKTDDTIRDIAGTDEVTPDKIEGGNQASKYFTDQYQAEKKEAGALVGQAKSLDTEGIDHLTGVTNAMSNSVPGVADMLDTSGGTIKVLPYKTSMGITDQTYGAVKKAVSALQDNPTKFSDLFNIRKGLSNGINPLTSDPAAVSEISSLKSSMMNYLQDQATPDLRAGFQRYAINEAQRGVIEKSFGASVGNKEYGQMSKVSPETIIKDIFSDSASINAAKNILPGDQYNHLLGNWMSQAKAAATDSETGIFSSRKFASFLKTNEPRLQAAFSDNPQGYQRIKDLTTMMKIVPDAPPVSPAIYDKSILEHLKETSGMTDAALKTVKYLRDSAMKNIDRQKNIREINKVLAGGNENPAEVPKGIMTALSKWVGRQVKDPESYPLIFRAMATNPQGLAAALDHADSMWKGNNLMQKQVNQLFTTGRVAAQVPFENSKSKEKIKKFIEDGTINEQLKNSINNSAQPQAPGYAEGGVVSSAPQQQTSLDALSSVLPDQAAMMATAKSRVAAYLNTVRPPTNPAKLPFDEEQKNPERERSYEKALTIADKPLSIMNEVKNGTIEPEHIRHMKQMWPEIHDQLSKKITDKLTQSRFAEEKMPPYHVRQAMSMFLGTPLDSAMTPSGIQAAQSVFAAQKAASMPMPQTKSKKDTSKMGDMSKQYATGSQAAEQRQISGKR
jgi:hypothetical protein